MPEAAAPATAVVCGALTVVPGTTVLWKVFQDFPALPVVASTSVWTWLGEPSGAVPSTTTCQASVGVAAVASTTRSARLPFLAPLNFAAATATACCLLTFGVTERVSGAARVSEVERSSPLGAECTMTSPPRTGRPW